MPEGRHHCVEGHRDVGGLIVAQHVISIAVKP